MKCQNQNRLSPVPGQMSYEATKPGFSFFLFLFCVVLHFFGLVNVCFCCVRFSFSLPCQEIGLGNLFCFEWAVNLNSLTQSISQNPHQQTYFSLLLSATQTLPEAELTEAAYWIGCCCRWLCGPVFSSWAVMRCVRFKLYMVYTFQ